MEQSNSQLVTTESKQGRIDALTTTQGWNEAQVKLLSDTIAKGASPDELKMFIAICGKTGLDPFTKQIHFIKRWDSKSGREVGQAQVGIDGYRLIAQRTGEYAGQDPPQWCGPDGQWRDIWLDSAPPAAARVGVYRHGHDRPTVATARWSAYCPTTKDGHPTQFWSKMGSEMLAKCAEALALRKAFPNELSGLYTKEEMEQATTWPAKTSEKTSEQSIGGPLKKQSAKKGAQATADHLGVELGAPPKIETGPPHPPGHFAQAHADGYSCECGLETANVKVLEDHHRQMFAQGDVEELPF